MEMMVETAFIYLGDIKHNKKVVSMGVDIWNKRDKLLLTSKRHFYV